MYLYVNEGSSHLSENAPDEDDIGNVAYGRLRVFDITNTTKIQELFAEWNDETSEGENPTWYKVRSVDN